MNDIAKTGAMAIQQRGENNAVAEVAAQREIAEVQAQIFMARQFPRDEVSAVDKIMKACTRESLAETATYTYARGGTDISGPSIRLAETIAQCWGNISFGVRELEQRNGESKVEAYAWDLETNARVNKVFQVSHIRHTRKGQERLTDPRDIYELVANNGMRRVRACILSVIPGDITEMAVRQCDTTLAASKNAVTPERVKAMVDKFKDFGVTKAQLEEYTQRSIEAITPAMMARLVRVYNSIKDGIAKPNEHFRMPDATERKPTSTSLLNRSGKSSEVPISPTSMSADEESQGESEIGDNDTEDVI